MEKEYGKSRDEVFGELKKHSIFARRYFYPLISQFPTYRGLPSASPENLPVAEKLSAEVLCIPIYPDLSLAMVEFICRIISNRHGKSID